MATPSLVIVPDRYKAGKLYSQIPVDGTGDFTVTRGTTATRVNASGLIESVASGVPRLDYTGGGCPSLLVEPAATNLALRSEEFDNAYWTKEKVTITPNNAVAPDGTMSADLVFPNANGTGDFEVGITRFTGGMSLMSRIPSFYIKPSGWRWVYLLDAGGSRRVWFDLQNGVVGTQQGTAIGVITLLSNGYYRIENRDVNNQTSFYCYIGFSDADNSTVCTASGTDGVHLWGAQIETGSVATSYIPTVASTVTRNADVITKTGVSGLIGQTEGTIYAEVDLRNIEGNKIIVNLSDGTADYRLLLQIQTPNTLYFYSNDGVGATVIASGTVTTGTHKIAASYSSGDVQMYLDGSFLASGTMSNYPTVSLTDVSIGARILSGVYGNFLNDRIRAAAIYTTRLSNSELASLTTL